MPRLFGGNKSYDGKKDIMGDNRTRDGNAVDKVAREVGIDRSRLKSLVEEQKVRGTANLSYDEIKQIARDDKGR